VDVNRLGQSAPTTLEHHTEIYAQRFSGFGWHTIEIDGHSVTDIIRALDEARKITNKPVAIIAKTFKGKYFPHDIEDQLNWHGKALKLSDIIKDLKAMMKNPEIKIEPKKPEFEFKWKEDISAKQHTYTIKSNYDHSKQVSTREAYGQSLKKLGEQDSNDHIIALDADVKNSTFSEYYEKAYPNKFINCYIAEQNMVSVALGIGKRNKIPFISTFGAFFTRAFDQIRMAAISFANVKFYGSHSGVHIGQDGPSQMGLEVSLY
jgi:transketolase